MDENENGLAREWIRKADHDLGTAELTLEQRPEYTDTICFHCQQAAEKYLKALLTILEIEFTKTHSLAYLLDLGADVIKVPDELYSLAGELDAFAVEVRYPDDRNDPDLDAALHALFAAKRFRAYP